jgi:hypothetical protein
MITYPRYPGKQYERFISWFYKQPRGALPNIMSMSRELNLGPTTIHRYLQALMETKEVMALAPHKLGKNRTYRRYFKK